MSDEAFDALRAQLGGEIPDGLRKLDDAHLHDLAGTIADARHRQSATIAAAGERAMGMIPRLLRGPIRRVMR